MQAMESLSLLLAVAAMMACASSAPAQSMQQASVDQARAWVVSLPDRTLGWLKTVQHQPKDGEPWGLFTFSGDSKIPYSVVSTNIVWAYADLCGGIERLPGYHPNAKQEMAAWVQRLQDPKTRQFIDPLLEGCVKDIDNPDARYTFREAVSKYAVGLLARCDAKPLYPYVFGGDEEGKFESKHYLEFIKAGDWDNAPWGIGSHAALQTFQLFKLVNEGREELIPTLIEGTEFIISKQNPKTGMWGTDKASLAQQIGGTLKVIGRFQGYMGLIVPHMDRLADSIIASHTSGAFYIDGDTPCVPRNVAEMAQSCMDVSDYRKDELRQVLVELADQLKRFERDDGGFSETWAGIEPVGWCQAVVSDKSARPRSDVVGVQLNVDTAVRLYQRLSWTGGPWKPAKDWKTYIEEQDFTYKIACDPSGKVQVTLRKPPER